MIEFLNACIVFLGVAGVAGLITGHEDGPALIIAALLALVVRLVPAIPAIADWVRGRVRRDG